MYINGFIYFLGHCIVYFMVIYRPFSGFRGKMFQRQPEEERSRAIFVCFLVMGSESARIVSFLYVIHCRQVTRVSRLHTNINRLKKNGSYRYCEHIPSSGLTIIGISY